MTWRFRAAAKGGNKKKTSLEGGAYGSREQEIRSTGQFLEVKDSVTISDFAAGIREAAGT